MSFGGEISSCYVHAMQYLASGDLMTYLLCAANESNEIWLLCQRMCAACYIRRKSINDTRYARQKEVFAFNGSQKKFFTRLKQTQTGRRNYFISFSFKIFNWSSFHCLLSQCNACGVVWNVYSVRKCMSFAFISNSCKTISQQHTKDRCGSQCVILTCFALANKI